MADKSLRKSRGTSKRAQAIVELAVFGAIFLFILGSIVQQGFGTMMYQEAQLTSMRKAMQASYIGGQHNNSKRNTTSVLVYEDRLVPGFSKFGVVDRVPTVSSASGSMSRNLYMPIDWNEISNPSLVAVQDLKVNGQTFELATSAAITVTFTRATATGNMKREWDDKCPVGGECYPWAYTVSAHGNANFTGDEDWQYDYDRDGNFANDLWMQGDKNLKASRLTRALWKWQREDLSQLVSKIDAAKGNYPVYDINGDFSEDTIFSLTLPGDGAGSFTANILDSMAGDISTEDADNVPLDLRQGMKTEATIYSQMEDGTVLEIRNGKAYIPGTMNLSRSVAQKHQYDVISRVYQLNPRMANPDAFITRNPNIERVDACTGAANLMYSCFDKRLKILYIRSRISDMRGRKWIYHADNDMEKSLLKP